MTVGDTNFPIPSPDFLFIHEVELKRPSSTTTDERGVAVTTYLPSETVMGYLTSPDPSNEDSAGTERIRFNAVVLLSRSLPVPSQETLIRCDDPQLPPNLSGTYKVEVVRPNISHTRCLLVRYTGPWEENTGV